MAIELADALVGALLMMALPYIISVGTAHIQLSMMVVIGLLISRRQQRYRRTSSGTTQSDRLLLLHRHSIYAAQATSQSHSNSKEDKDVDPALRNRTTGN